MRPVDHLKGRDLDFWTLLAEGATLRPGYVDLYDLPGDRVFHVDAFMPSTDHGQCAQLQSRNWIGLSRPSRGQTPPVWRALGDMPDEAVRRVYPHGGTFGVVDATSEDMLEAVCRVRVKMHYGEFVPIQRPVVA